MNNALSRLLWLAFSAGYTAGLPEEADDVDGDIVTEDYANWLGLDYVQRVIRDVESTSKTTRVQESLGNVGRSGMDLNSLVYSVSRWIDLAQAEGVNRGLVHLDTMKEIYEELSRLQDLER
jgi:hypothetical protein